MSQKLPTLVATSVVRGSQQGESHGGIFTINFEEQAGQQHVDWNSGDINFEGRGADRGLRGIAFDGDDIYVAACTSSAYLAPLTLNSKRHFSAHCCSSLAR
jgi:hypothetical protein